MLIVLDTCFFVVLRLFLVVLFTGCDANYGYCTRRVVCFDCLLLLFVVG